MIALTARSMLGQRSTILKLTAYLLRRSHFDIFALPGGVFGCAISKAALES